MNVFNKRMGVSLVAMTALLLSHSSAQQINTSLPLTSVGDQLRWEVGDQTLTLNVPISGQVKLELYSPRVDQKDYRSDSYYGDEQYDGNASAVTTTFTLLDASGNVVVSRAFAPGAHAWETLFDQPLTSGTYRLQAVTQGNGKNTFALRLSGGSAAISAEHLTVNVHSQTWVPVVNVVTDGPGYVLRMYDGDGAGELSAQIKDANGNVTPLTVSGDLDWLDIPLPDAAGRYSVELRQNPQAAQYSNTVGFALKDRPITLTEVNETGLLKLGATLILPNETRPTTANVQLDGQDKAVNGKHEETVLAGTHTLRAEPVAGATVTVEPSNIEVPKNGVGQAEIRITPNVALSLSADKTEVCLGDTVTLTARAQTEFAGELPFDLQLQAAGLEVTELQRKEGQLSAENPAEIRLEAKATEAGLFTLQAALAPWNQTQRVQLRVRSDVTALQLQRAAIAPAKVGDEVTVTLTVKNTSDTEVPFTLSDQAGDGLEALEKAEWSGTLAAGESRDLTYRARVLRDGDLPLQASLQSPSCGAAQNVSGTLQVTPKAISRSSVVNMPFEAPARATQLVVAHSVPAGATYQLGSSRLDGQPLPDPVRGASGTLYWVIPAQAKGMVTYNLSHTEVLGSLPRPSLLARLPGERTELLQGTFNQADWQQATPLGERRENAGSIKLPLSGSVYRSSDRIDVVVETAQGQRPQLVVNGVAVSDATIGTDTQDSVRGVQRLTFVGVPLKSGVNVLRYGEQEIQVTPSDKVSRVEFIPETLIADGSTPLRLKVRTLDEAGNPSADDAVTVKTNLEPRTPDAQRTVGGYQVKLVQGEGVLELQPQTAPTTLTIEALSGDKIVPYRFAVVPDRSSIGVGVVSATVGVSSPFSLEKNLLWTARAYAEMPIGSGKLYVAADKDGLPKTEHYFKRFSTFGDASTEEIPLQGIDPVAALYDHPTFRAAYRHSALPMTVLPVGETLTALSVVTKSNPELAGFVAAVPTQRVTDYLITPDGTRTLRLPISDPKANIAQNSETLVVITQDRSTGAEISRQKLLLNVDYTLDYNTGVVTLVRPLAHLDAHFNAVRLSASYRLDGGIAERQLAYGTQVRWANDDASVGAGVVQLDGHTTFGLRATYDAHNWWADAQAAYAQGVKFSAAITRKLERQTAHLSVRYQDWNYAGIAPLQQGLNVAGHYELGVTPLVTVVADGEYNNNLHPEAAKATSGGEVSLRADANFKPFSVGLGAKYGFGTREGVGVIGKVGYDLAPLRAEIVHTQRVTGTLPTTTNFGLHYDIAKNVTLGLTDKVTWGVGQEAALSLDSQVGNVNYAIGYELPTASGAGNRARFGVRATYPISDQLALGLHGSAIYAFSSENLEIGAGADLTYKAERYLATTGIDVAYDKQHVNKVVWRGGITGSLSDQLTLSADALAEFYPEYGTQEARTGQKFSVGYGYRARNFSSLGYARLLSGTLAKTHPELMTGIVAEYRQPTWSLRGGFDTRNLLDDQASFSYQVFGGGTVYLTDWFGLGAWGRMLAQPNSGLQLYGYGLEASVRPLPGTWLSAGYNFKGFDGLAIPSAYTYTKPGAYLRLDLTLDETLGGINERYDLTGRQEVKK